jgi:tetratricopeptide (TPR) repeat protein
MLNWLGRLLRAPPAAASPQDQTSALVRDALAHGDAGRGDEAERLLYRALALQPASAEIHNNLGNVLRSAGRLDGAIEAYRSAIALAPGLAEAHFNLGLAILQRGDAPGAMQCFRASLQSRPGFADAHLNLGFLLEGEGDNAGAIACYRSAVALEPELVEAHVNLGMQLLLAGHFPEGWREYEWRLRYPEYSGADLAAGDQGQGGRWDGVALDGRTILLDAEQGFGDAIQFLRYAPLVAERGGRVLMRCAPELAALAASAPGVATTVTRGGSLPPFDTYCPLPSLPLVFGTSLETIPARVPYLRADPEQARRWKLRLAGGAAQCRIGLVWASQSKHRTAAEKSLPLAALAPLAAIAGLRFYSLQKGEAAAQAERPPAGMRIENLSDELRDFSDTAAAVANLDLVISVDTAVAHLAGAMGRPAWTLLKFAPDWRWLLAREDSPWYPTMRLFRQQKPADWYPVIGAVTAALPRFAAAGRRGAR